jgi:hypothetical protein
MAPALLEVSRVAMRTARRLRACGLLLVAASLLGFGACVLNPQPLPPGDGPEAGPAGPTTGTGGSGSGGGSTSGGTGATAANDGGEPADSAPLPVQGDSSQDGESPDALVEGGPNEGGEADAMGDQE